MKNDQSPLLKEIEFLKAENQHLKGLAQNGNYPELNWLTQRNAEIIIRISEREEILAITPTVSYLLGYSVEELTGKELTFLIHPLDLPIIRKILAVVIAGSGTEEICHIRAKHRPEEWVWIEATVCNQLLNPEIGAILIVVQIMKLVREGQKQGSLPIVQYHDLFKAIADGLFINIVRGDHTLGDFIIVNDAACLLTDYSREELLHMSPADMNARPRALVSPDRVERMLGGESVLFETSFRKKGGSEFPVEIQASIFRLEEQRAMISLVRDISERKQVEESKQRSEQLIKENLAELNKMNQRLEVLRTIDHAIMESSPNENAVNEMAMQGILLLIPCEEVELITFNFDKGEACVESSIVNGKFDATAKRIIPLSLFDIPFLKKGKAQLSNINPAVITSKSDEALLQLGIRNIIRVPMVDHEGLTGLFVLLSHEADHFKPSDLQIAQDIGSQIMVNLRQRSLTRQLQQYNTDLEKLVASRTSELQAILNAVPDMIFRMDQDGTFLDSRSKDPSDLFVPADQFLGKKIVDVLPPEVAKKAMEVLHEVFTTRQIIPFEYELEKDGEIRNFEDRLVALSDHEALSIIRDITERKRADHALRWNESLLRKMTSTSPLAFFVVDNRTDDIIYFTHQFCEIWGITHLEERMRRGELKNNDIIPDCLPVLKDIPAFAESCKPLQDEKNQIVVEDEIPFIDGRIIRRFTAQIRGEQDEYYGRLYIFEDITRRKTTEQFIRIQRDLASRYNTTNTLSEALTLALNTLMEIDGVDGGAIYMLDETSGGLKILVHHGLSDEFIASTLSYGPESPNAILVKEGVPFYSDNSENDLGSTGFLDEEGILSLAVLPMQYEGVVNGCINLASKKRLRFYEKVSFSLEALAMQIGGTIARIKVETALKRSQQNFQELFDTLDDFMFILDAEGRIIKTNPVVRKRLGYTEEELYMTNVLQVHPPERREEAGFIVNEMLEGRALFCPVPLITKQGGEIPVETRVVLGKWDDKHVLFGISRDITERKKMEQALRESEARWNFALEGSGDGVWDWNLETNEVFFSTQWKKMLGYADHEIGNTLSEWEKKVHPDDLQRCYDSLEMHFRGETDVYINEQRVVCKDGSYKWILDRGKVVTWKADGKPLRVIGTHSDISERKRYEQMLRQGIEKEKELGQLKSKFISVASHEFRTPLSTIMATSESLLSYRDRMTQSQQDERIIKIKDQVTNLNKIIDEVLHLSKLQTREKELKPELFNLSLLIHEAIEESKIYSGRDIAISFHSSPPNIEVTLDMTSVKRIIDNLISNAIKYSPTGKKMMVGIKESGDHAILTVQDHGMGIPPNELNLLFTPFFRASNVVNIDGTGLGLSIVKESVERHGGKVSVTSVVGEGTLFTVLLPKTL